MPLPTKSIGGGDGRKPPRSGRVSNPPQKNKNMVNNDDDNTVNSRIPINMGQENSDNSSNPKPIVSKEPVRNNRNSRLGRVDNSNRSSSSVGKTQNIAKVTGENKFSKNRPNLSKKRGSELPNNSDLPDGWAIDEETGVKYKVLPKTEWDPKNPGFSQSHFDDSDDATYDLNSLANTFLGHLRVAPSKEELERLRREKARQAKLKNKEYEEMVSKLPPDEDEISDND